jgi:hypothetical protein
LATVKTRRAEAYQDAEPYLIATVLPRCRSCGAQHPHSLKPMPLLRDTCHVCETPCSEGESVYVKAALGGFWGVVATGFLKVGRWLRAQSRKV